MNIITIPIPNFIAGCFVVFVIGFSLPFVLKQLGLNIL